MPYCTRCGVEVNEEAEKCPLCHSPIQKFYEDPSPGREYPSNQLHSAAPQLSPKERTRLALFMTSFGILIPLLITLAVDMAVTRSISWSIYPLVGLIGSWLLTIPPLKVKKNPKRIIWMEAVILCGTLAAFHLIAGMPREVVSLGSPIALTAALISHIIVNISSRSKRKGGNIAGFILIGTGLFCGCTDLILSLRLQGIIHMGWSLIVMAATLPVSGMLLYLHYRKKKSKASKFFHI